LRPSALVAASKGKADKMSIQNQPPRYFFRTSDFCMMMTPPWSHPVKKLRTITYLIFQPFWSRRTMAETRPVILCISASAMPIARTLSLKFSAEIHGLRSRVSEVEVLFDQFEIHLRQLFRMQVPIIGICSSAILIRLLAPELSEKRKEPPVLAIAEDGSVVVPLLGGHRGANRLARQMAEELGCSAALTTAGDLRFGIALDDPPDSLLLANPEATKDFMFQMSPYF